MLIGGNPRHPPPTVRRFRMFPLPEINFRRTPATLILMAVAVALEVVCTFNPEQRGYYYNDLRLGILSLIWEWELWRPFTTTLLHGNLFHALFNVYWLAMFGGPLERHFGSPRFLGLVVLLSYVSTLPQFLIDNFNAPVDAQIGVVGLSGVGYGLFGMLWVGRRWRPELREACDDGTVRLFVAWFVFCIVATYAKIMPVGNIAHGAGCLFGVLYGMAAFRPHRRRRWLALAAVSTALVLATLIGFPHHRGYENIRLRRQYRRALELMPHLPATEQPEDGDPVEQPGADTPAP